MDFPIVITNNYEDLFERAVRDEGKEPRVSVYKPEGEPTTEFDNESAQSPVIDKLHGDRRVRGRSVRDGAGRFADDRQQVLCRRRAELQRLVDELGPRGENLLDATQVIRAECEQQLHRQRLAQQTAVGRERRHLQGSLRGGCISVGGLSLSLWKGRPTSVLQERGTPYLRFPHADPRQHLSCDGHRPRPPVGGCRVLSGPVGRAGTGA